MTEYNPFDADLDALTGKDLQVLSDVSEGWYVEYKSNVVNASAIAKSISAFANTYGGWLFFGIEEKSKDEPVAGRFIGISQDSIDAGLQSIRNAVSQCLNPAPFYRVAIIRDEDHILQMEAGAAIICVQVPLGSEAPYIHNSGRVYRRVGDSSDPKPESDRFVLDQLWQRGEKIRDEYRNWIKRDLELSKAEAKQPYFRLFVTPDLWRDRDIWADLTTKKVRDLFNSGPSAETIFTTPFDCVYKTNRGFVGRQAKGNDPHRLSATWFLRPDLVSEIIFPFPTLKDIDREMILYELDGYDFAEKYSEALRRHNHQSVDLIDLNFLFASLNGAMHIQSLLDQEASRSGSIFAKAELTNVWRHRPFLDVEKIVEDQYEHGVPVSLHDRLLAPHGDEPEDFRVVPSFEHLEDRRMRKFFQAMTIFEPIAASLGIETGLEELASSEAESDDTGHIYADLIDAANRASIAQDLRNERYRQSEDRY